MTREHKIALIVGFALVLLVGVAVSDHLSQARTAQLETGLTEGEPLAEYESPRTRIPDSTPIDRFAAVPEWPARTQNSVAMTPDNPESNNAPVTDFLTRLRDRVQDMPIAAKTQTADQQPSQTESPQQASFAPTKAAESSPAVMPPAATYSDSEIVWHSVAEGETLWSIANKHYGDGALAAKLAEFNGARASNPDMIRVGVRLRVPPRHVLTGEAVPTITQTPRPAAKTDSFRLYTIKRGDTLGAIAMRELGTIKRMQEIVKLNESTLRDLDNIPVGATIRLPAK